MYIFQRRRFRPLFSPPVRGRREREDERKEEGKKEGKEEEKGRETERRWSTERERRDIPSKKGRGGRIRVRARVELALAV